MNSSKYIQKYQLKIDALNKKIEGLELTVRDININGCEFAGDTLLETFFQMEKAHAVRF